MNIKVWYHNGVSRDVGEGWVIDVYSRKTIDDRDYVITRLVIPWYDKKSKPPIHLLYSDIRYAVNQHKVDYKKANKKFYGYY